MHLHMLKFTQTIEHITFRSCAKFDNILSQNALVEDLQSEILGVFLRAKVDVHFSVSLQKPAPHDTLPRLFRSREKA